MQHFYLSFVYNSERDKNPFYCNKRREYLMDSSRFKELLLPLSAKLYKTAYRIVNDTDTAKDMVQDAYATMWTKRDILDELECIESFAVKIVRNRCIDHLRTQHAHFDINDSSVNIANNEAYSEDAYDKNESLSRVMLMMKRLPERQRKVLMMRSVQELSLEEIEQATGLSNINVRTLLSRARKRLKELCVAEINI